jgi:MFS family permease
MTTITSSSSRLQRDQFTLVAYLLFGYFAYMLIAIGPVMPFLQEELSMTYTLGALHLSVMSVGSLPVGFFGDYLIQWVGRRAMLWISGAGMAIGAVLLMLGSHVAITLTGACIMGTMGIFIPIIVQAALSDHYQQQRLVVLSEVQVVVMLFAALVPLVIGGSEYLGMGWRSALFLAVGGWIIIAIRFHRISIPEPTVTQSASSQSNSRKLPTAFWAYWLILLLGVAIEWCVSLWGASFFKTIVGIEPAAASTMMSIFFVGMVIGRFITRQLVATYPIIRLLLITQATTLVGFLLFWLSPLAMLNIAGLFVVGLGVAGIFPLALSAGMHIAAEQSNVASARMSMAAGIAMLVAPFFLGWFADTVGLFIAYAIVLLLLGIIAAITLSLRGKS